VIVFDLSEGQESVDRFYWVSQGKPCCAGCDWWRHMNSTYGDCTQSAPVSEADRWAMTGITNSSLRTGAGHVVTPRHHRCGQFADTFNWQSLPPAYLRRIGYRERRT
jgi:hypothetical protein